MDESHTLGSTARATDSQQTEAVAALAEGVPHVVLLSGTPSLSRPIADAHDEPASSFAYFAPLHERVPARRRNPDAAPPSLDDDDDWGTGSEESEPEQLPSRAGRSAVSKRLQAVHEACISAAFSSSGAQAATMSA